MTSSTTLTITSILENSANLPAKEVVNILFTSGIQHFKGKQYHEAFQYFSAALIVDENNPYLYSNRCACLTHLKSYKEAIHDAKMCIKLRPNWSKGYYRLAVVLEKLKETAKAYKAISLAFANEPSCQLYRDLKSSLREEIVNTEGEELVANLDREIGHLVPKDTGVEIGPDGLEERQPIPVTVLSGFLGSGKTTMISNLLTNTDRKIALIVNDMSEVNIDANVLREKQVSISAASDNLVELTNGCICCTLREDLMNEIVKIATTRLFDCIIVESTGISEPIPVAQTFLFEDIQGNALSRIARLDTMVTVVDCSSFLEDLGSLQNLKDRKWETSQDDRRSISNLLIDQVEFANVVVLNKIDLTSQGCVDKVSHVVNSLNPSARITQTSFGKLDPTLILDTKLFDPEKASKSPGWLQELRGEHMPETEEYGIRSWVFTSTSPFCAAELFRLSLDRDFLYKQCSVLRSKGSCCISEDCRLVVDWACAGRQISCEAKGFWPEVVCGGNTQSHSKCTQVVFIGIDLNVEKLKSRLQSLCVAEYEQAMVDHEKEEYWPMVQDIVRALTAHDIADSIEFTREQVSTVMRYLSQSETQKRFDVVTRKLQALQEKPGELSMREGDIISGLSEEYVSLLKKLNMVDEDGDVNELLQTVQHEVKQLSSKHTV